MKILFENYSFNSAAKTVTFNTSDVITLEQLLIITNVTTNKIIYNFADPNAGGIIVNNVLTLDFNTTTMSSSDKLQIFVDNILTPASEESIQYLKKIAQLVSPLSTQDGIQRQRVVAEVTNIGNANLLNSQVFQSLPNALQANVFVQQIGGVDGRFQFIDAARLTYAQGIRRNLQFS
jgi:hypothetical protein